MSQAYKYTSLITSLPACQNLFGSKITPISRIQLEQRLRVLEIEDYKDIEILGELLDWFRHPLNRTDDDLLKLAREKITQLNSEAIRVYIDWRLEFRTLVAALRHKHRNSAHHGIWSGGYGRWALHIEKHWNEKYFGLEKIYPWLVEVNRLMEKENAQELERLILNFVWQWLEKESFGHEFDLEAVAIYRMRWDLVARWTSYVKEPALARFSSLLDAAFQAA